MGKCVSSRRYTRVPYPPLTRFPFPNEEGKEETASPPKKGSQPRLAALGSPFQGKGLAWTLPPSYGRRCPEGAEVGWGWRDERSEGRSFQLRRLRQYPNTAQQILSWHCPKRGKEESARRFAWPLISPKILIKSLQWIPCYATILPTLGWPGFFKCEFSTCTDSVICDILIKHVNWPSAEERWNEV